MRVVAVCVNAKHKSCRCINSNCIYIHKKPQNINQADEFSSFHTDILSLSHSAALSICVYLSHHLSISSIGTHIKKAIHTPNIDVYHVRMVLLRSLFVSLCTFHWCYYEFAFFCEQQQQQKKKNFIQFVALFLLSHLCFFYILWSVYLLLLVVLVLFFASLLSFYWLACTSILRWIRTERERERYNSIRRRQQQQQQQPTNKTQQRAKQPSVLFMCYYFYLQRLRRNVLGSQRFTSSHESMSLFQCTFSMACFCLVAFASLFCLFVACVYMYHHVFQPFTNNTVFFFVHSLSLFFRCFSFFLCISYSLSLSHPDCF